MVLATAIIRLEFMDSAISSVQWMWRLGLLVALIGTLSSTVFLGMVLVAAARYRRRAESARKAAASISASALPAVTLLKPVHGMEPRLAENLESFFQQDYPDFEIVF